MLVFVTVAVGSVKSKRGDPVKRVAPSVGFPLERKGHFSEFKVGLLYQEFCPLVLAAQYFVVARSSWPGYREAGLSVARASVPSKCDHMCFA